MAIHPHWQAALPETSADDEGSVVQGQAAEEHKGFVTPLSEQGIIRVSGYDARDFLHAQLSNSVTDLDDGTTRLAAWCSPKGKTLALMRIVPSGDDFLLLLDRSLVAYTIKRLKFFVLRSDVTLTDLSDDWAAVGFAGAEALAFISNSIAAPQQADESIAWLGELGLLRLAASEPRLMLLGPAEAVIAQWQSATEVLAPASSEAWNLMLVRDGQPDITAATSDSFVPQMLNLEPLGGLSFTKGCYPGQEIVARLHYRGQLKRRVYRLQLVTDAIPEPGTELDDGSGVIVKAANGPETVEALAVIGIDRAERGDITYQGEPVRFDELPYAKPEG